MLPETFSINQQKNSKKQITTKTMQYIFPVCFCSFRCKKVDIWRWAWTEVNDIVYV